MAAETEIEVLVVSQTDDAVLVQFHPDTPNESDEIWVPKSVIIDPDELDDVDEDGVVTIEMKKWFLKKNDILYGDDLGEPDDY